MNSTRRSLLTGIPAFMLGGGAVKALTPRGSSLLSEESALQTLSFGTNPNLPTILKGWKGTPQDSAGRFINHEHPHKDDLFRLIDWQMNRNPYREEKKKDTFRLRVVHDSSFLKSDFDCLVWFGHSTFFIRLGGVSFITDPVFGNIFLRDRLCGLPVSPEYLTQLDYVLLSHVHQDHADEASLKYLAKYNPQMQYLCGLEAGEPLSDWIGSSNLQQAGWFQQYDTTQIKGGRKVEVYYHPSRHWSRRGIFDQNRHLWGSFVIRANGRTIYFGGDSGFGSHFAQVRELFGNIDLCILGVGAYKPEWFMGQSHTSPRDAVRAADAMNAKTMIPMHYATYDLSDEAPGDPVRVLENIRRDEKPQTKIELPVVGELLRL